MLNRLINSWGAGQTQAVAVAALAFLSFFSLSSTASGQNANNSGVNFTGSPAAAAQSQVAPGQQVQLEGQLEILYQDFKDGRHPLSYSLKQPDGTRVPLQFVKEPPTHLLTGAHVSVSGQMSGGSLILYSGSTNVKQTGTPTTSSGDATGSTTSSIPVPNTFGAQYTLVILVNFQDAAVQPFTVTDAQNAIFGTANNFFQEDSYGQTSITGDVVGWYTIPVSVTTCDTSQIASAAQNAATAAGVNLSAYTRYMYVFPQDNACSWGGASYVGGKPSQSWLNGTLVADVVNHELGHALGLWHSHSLDCGTTATICSGGTVYEYGDNIDVMGAIGSAAPDYNAFQKERLGWLNYGSSPKIQTVTASGTYTISAYEDGSGPNALKILQSTNPTTGAKTWYYLEARQAIGFDAFLTTWPYSSTQNETTGVLFHLGTDGNGNSSLMLNMVPSMPTYDFEMSLAVGQSFSDPTAGATFTPTAVGSTGVTVQIAMNGSGSACAASNPSVSVSPSQSQYVTAGTAVNFTVSVKDNDNSSCAPATFNLGDALPSGWSGVWSAAALSLSPGTSGSTMLTVTSAVGTADGSYNLAVSATNASASTYSGTATAAYVISTAPLSISLTTNQSSYLPGQTVGIGVSLLYGTLPDAGASVTVTVTAPNGKTTTLSSTTGGNGVASLNYKLSNHAAAGTYQVRFGTTVKGASPTVGASTSFTVQ